MKRNGLALPVAHCCSTLIPMMERLWCAAGGDNDTALVNSLKVLDPKRPIREADIARLDNVLLNIREHFVSRQLRHSKWGTTR